MVALALLGPVLVGAGLFVLQRLAGFDLLALVAGSPWIYLFLVLGVLVALLAAAYRRRDNLVLMSAWLFLFCGTILVSLGQVTDLYLVSGEACSSEILTDAAFVPLLIFALYVAAPVRLLVMPRRRKLLFWVLGVALFTAVAAAVLVPWLLVYDGPRLHRDARHMLRMAQPLLDVLLLAPVGVFVLSLGWFHGREPYPLIGLGLLFSVPADILEHYHLLSHLALQAELAFLFALTCQLYLLAGALLCVTCKRRQDAQV